MQPAQEFLLDAKHHRVGDTWSVIVDGLGEGVLYLYRMDGPKAPSRGHRFDPTHYLLDPYARAIVGDASSSNAKCVVLRDVPAAAPGTRPRTPMGRTIIYEMHVRGFSVRRAGDRLEGGAYRDAIAKIPYLKELGVTAVELLPVQACGEETLPRTDPETGAPLVNYWGYSPISFFGLNSRYAQDPDPAAVIAEFREMVEAFHAAGIEVYLDVVYNHTSEKDGPGHSSSFRGIDNSIYYLLDEKGNDRNLTGCGHTFHCNHPVVRDLILDSLRYWVGTMNVDGFRFDLAPILRRDRFGTVLHEGPLVEHIAEDAVLREVKLIAEPWDIGGAYLVGAFGGEAWSEWNGRYRDDVRRFWRGDAGTKGNFALRLTGSPDLYEDDGRTPLHSINFVTAHDGFTLRDLVSYNKKHNLPNGEDNRDGLDENYSWNCGDEGDTDDPAVLALRRQMQKNFLTTLFVSLGVPMLLGGDEFGRSQRGNNNAYCQDNEISWFDWSLLDTNRELFTFCKNMIRFRKENPVFSRDRYFTGKPSRPTAGPDVLWFDAAGKPQDWGPNDPTIACLIDGAENGGVDLYLAFNPGAKTARFVLPQKDWRVRVETAAPPPDEFWPVETARRVRAGRAIVVKPHSLAVLSRHPQ
jgi:glycogen operon protein